MSKLITAYIICGILSFGHSAGNSDIGADNSTWSSEKAGMAIEGFLAGALWPLYASWVIFEDASNDE